MLCKQLTGTEGTPVLKWEHLKKNLWRIDQVSKFYYEASNICKMYSTNLICTSGQLFSICLVYKYP